MTLEQLVLLAQKMGLDPKTAIINTRDSLGNSSVLHSHEVYAARPHSLIIQK